MAGEGGKFAALGIMKAVRDMAMLASNEGVVIIDKDDDLVTTQASVFSGISEVMLQLAQQISGAYQIPLVRLLGQSPVGSTLLAIARSRLITTALASGRNISRSS